MITKLNVATIYVLDKDEAVDFYVDKLGLEKGNDVQQGAYRWLTVRVPGNDGTEISLEQPGPPLHDDATAEQLRELITKGALGGLVLNTDDVRGYTRPSQRAASPTSSRSPPISSTALT
jgi:catechol 2,3-dioxygenase-like lactoylglutathione lyase family enzyme